MTTLLHRPTDPLEAEGASRLVGAKAARLIEAAAIGAPVPAFFVLTTALFAERRRRGKLPDELVSALDEGLVDLARVTGHSFGSAESPLVVSVRSSPVESMPGMLDTVLDVGLTRAATPALARRLGDPIAAQDVRRSQLESWGAVDRRMARTRCDASAAGRVAASRSAASRERPTLEAL